MKQYVQRKNQAPHTVKDEKQQNRMFISSLRGIQEIL